MKFKRPWRAYQARVLATVKSHLSDGRLHIVAAPGAGKTTLGIEFFRRIGRPALVLAPSRTIRDQWIARLQDFLPDNRPPNWAGTDLAENTFFTAITYQALHTKYRRSAENSAEDETAPDDSTSTALDEAPNQSELAEVIARCQQLGVGTIILDEAHHLRQEWWRVLSSFIESLGRPVLVGLTATPPYNVASLEWRRYEELCGPIDEEISVPELVRADALCPHQDFVWMCPPSEKDRVTARHHDEAVRSFLAEITTDQALLDAVRQHPWITEISPNPDAILEDPEFAVSLLIFLKCRQASPPDGLLKLLDSSWGELPKPDPRWWSVLLKHYLFDDTWPAACTEHRQNLSRLLRDRGLLFRRELRLLRHTGLQTAFSQSSAKIRACLEIHRLERRNRGAALRQVVLTDFIRDRESDRLGAWPIFRRLVESEGDASAGLALLTGRVSLVPAKLFAELTKEFPGLEGSVDQDLPNFIRTARPSALTGPLTACLAAGRLHTLVGTRSLLGEGWDCPPVNSLVLASYVGAFVATNQMRGRAIRVDSAAPQKIASIWHLVAIDPTTPSGLGDLEQLREKFETFTGLHHTKPTIESGLARLELPKVSRELHLSRLNIESARRAEALHNLGARWRTAVEGDGDHRIRAAVDSPPLPGRRSVIFANTLRYLLYSAFWGFVGGTGDTLRGVDLRKVIESGNLRWVLIVAALVGLAFSLPKFLKCLWIAWRHLPVDGSLKQIGEAVLAGLQDANLITTARGRLDLVCTENEPGRFSVTLVGATFHESSLFADSLETVLGPIENPRYLVSRQGILPWAFGRKDYHSVPPVLAAKKEFAEAFHRHWKRRTGGGELIFTRSADGRRALLQARAKALSTAFTQKVRRCDRWS